MNVEKLPPWLQSALASLGGAGIFLVAFLDSSVLSFPVINDLLVVHYSIRNPLRMPFYALMATLGSLAGSVWLYYMAKKGGELVYRRKAGPRAERIRSWVQRNAFVSVAVPSILPPPTPFKLFVLAAGVFQVPVKTFVIALLAGRGFRYFAEGFLAIRYGTEAVDYLKRNKLEVSLLALGVLLLFYLASRLAFRRSHPPA